MDRLEAMLNPRTGFVATAKFLTIASVNEWLDKSEPEPRTVPEHKLLAPIDDPKISEPDRVKRLEKMRLLKLGIQMKWVDAVKEQGK